MDPSWNVLYGRHIMHIYSKAAVAVLAVVIVSFPNFAQTLRQGPPPDQSQGPDGMGPRGLMQQMRPGEPRGQGGRMGMRGRGMGPQEFGLGRLLNDPNVRQQLGVTADQAAKIRQQDSNFRKTQIRNRADLEIKRMDLNELLSADKPDRSAIDSKLQEVGAAQLALEKSAIDYRLTMRDALTPAQRQKLQQMRAQRRQPIPMPMTGGNAAPRGPRGVGPGGRGVAPPPNAQGQAPPNQ
jgi:Spy/CpxP family protein refolding chaperone